MKAFPSETNDSLSPNLSQNLSPDFHTKISDPVNNAPKKLPKARTSLFSSDVKSLEDFGIASKRLYPITSKITPSNPPSFSTLSTNMAGKKKTTQKDNIYLCRRSNQRLKPAINRKRTVSLSALHSREKIARVSESNTPEKSRKFFKNKVNKNQLQVENEKKLEESIAVIPETFDLIETNLLYASVNIDESIKSLDDESNSKPETGNSITISAYYCQINEDNSILLHKPPEEDDIYKCLPSEDVLPPGRSYRQTVPKSISTDEIIMEPTSNMGNMTSSLALTNPKKNQINKAENLTNRLDMCDTNMEAKNTGKIEKLYPLFLKRKHFDSLSPSRKMTRQRRTWCTLDVKQYQLDAGQKRRGLTQCSHCEFVYQQSHPEEEQRHTDFHKKTYYLRYHGWKNERVVDQFNQAKIIEVDRNDKKTWWKKIEDLLFVVDKDLGYVEDENRLENIYKAYFCVEKRQIVGLITTEVVSRAHRMLADSKVDCCSTETYPVKCGVSRIWVAADSRRLGIATRMMNVLRNTFISDYRLTLTDIAFSIPSDSGKLFIKKFTNTDSYFVYND